MAALLAPVQLGFGIKHGIEAAVHGGSLYLQNVQRGQTMLKLDFNNAFNTLSRDELLRAVKEQAPELYPFAYICYENATHLIFRDVLLRSEEGAQQGDPLGPLFFCLTVKNLFSKLKSEFGVWYLDDGTLGGSGDNLLNDFQTVLSEARHIGLTLNEQKCELITSDQNVIARFRSVAPDILVLKPEQAVLLGAPVGDSTSVDYVLK